MLTPELEKEIEEQIAAMTAMYRNGQIGPDIYNKLVVCMAYEYAVAGEPLRAASLAQAIPVEYFRDVQPKQMQEDPRFAVVSYELAMKLLQSGYVHVGPTLATNQPAAKA